MSDIFLVFDRTEHQPDHRLYNITMDIQIIVGTSFTVGPFCNKQGLEFTSINHTLKLSSIMKSNPNSSNKYLVY